jgi:hypothetical protein
VSAGYREHCRARRAGAQARLDATPRLRRTGRILLLADGSTEVLSYPPDGHRALAAVEDGSYWFRHRNRAITRVAARRHLGGAFWNAGAAGARSPRTCSGAASRSSPSSPGRWRPLRPRPRHRSVVAGTLEQLAQPVASIAPVGLFDVVAHLEHPAAPSSSVMCRTPARYPRPGPTRPVAGLRTAGVEQDDLRHSRSPVGPRSSTATPSATNEVGRSGTRP